MKCGVNLVIPRPVGASHNVEIVEFAPRNCSYHVISLWNEYEIAIMHGDRLIKLPRSIHPLDGASVGWLNVMVIRFFEICFIWRIFCIMLMWRETRPVACRSNDFDKDQPLGLLICIQQVLHSPERIALSSLFNAGLFRFEQTCWKRLACCRCACYSHFHHIGRAPHLVAAIGRQIEGVRCLLFKYTESLTNLPYRLAIELCFSFAIEHNQGCLPTACCSFKHLVFAEVVHSKRDIAPAGTFRRNINRAKNSIYLLSLWSDQ